MTNQEELNKILITLKAIKTEVQTIEEILESKKKKMTTKERFNIMIEYIKENWPVNKTNIRNDLKPVGKNRFASFFTEFVQYCRDNQVNLHHSGWKSKLYFIK